MTRENGNETCKPPVTLFALEEMDRIIEGSPATPAERGVSPNSANGNETERDEARTSGNGIVAWENGGVLYVRGAYLNEKRFLADDLRLGAATAVAIFAPDRDSSPHRHQKFRASCEETPSPREQADLFAVSDVMKACQTTGKPMILIRHEKSFMP